MASTIAPLRPLPVPQQLLLDSRTGRIDNDWYKYLKQLDEHIREIEKRLDAGGL